jgi:hypothetical protein
MATRRVQLWADALHSLGTPELGGQLVDILNRGDRHDLEHLLPPGLLETGGCIDVVETLTKVLNFGPGRWRETCEMALALLVGKPSATAGRIFIFPDGIAHFVTDAEWWADYRHATDDLEWRAENKELLKVLGILVCSRTFVADDQLVQLNRSQTICFPAVLDPYA